MFHVKIFGYFRGGAGGIGKGYCYLVSGYRSGCIRQQFASLFFFVGVQLWGAGLFLIHSRKNSFIFFRVFRHVDTGKLVAVFYMRFSLIFFGVEFGFEDS